VAALRLLVHSCPPLILHSHIPTQHLRVLLPTSTMHALSSPMCLTYHPLPLEQEEIGDTCVTVLVSWQPPSEDLPTGSVQMEAFQCSKQCVQVRACVHACVRACVRMCACLCVDCVDINTDKRELDAGRGGCWQQQAACAALAAPQQHRMPHGSATLNCLVHRLLTPLCS